MSEEEDLKKRKAGAASAPNAALENARRKLESRAAAYAREMEMLAAAGADSSGRGAWAALMRSLGRR
jgi:hypothetical protein